MDSTLSPREQCREKALTLLDTRAHSVAELKRKLYASRKFTGADIMAVISDLLKVNLLNDRLFAEEYLRYLKTTSIGKLRAIQKLRLKGIPQQLVQEVVEQNWADSDEEDFNNAMAIARAKWNSWQKRNEQLPKKRQRLARFLLGKGFGGTIASRVLSHFS